MRKRTARALPLIAALSVGVVAAMAISAAPAQAGSWHRTQEFHLHCWLTGSRSNHRMMTWGTCWTRITWQACVAVRGGWKANHALARSYISCQAPGGRGDVIVRACAQAWWIGCGSQSRSVIRPWQWQTEALAILVTHNKKWVPWWTRGRAMLT
jgi:hypothetical protein